MFADNTEIDTEEKPNRHISITFILYKGYLCRIWQIPFETKVLLPHEPVLKQSYNCLKKKNYLTKLVSVTGVLMYNALPVTIK